MKNTFYLLVFLFLFEKTTAQSVTLTPHASGFNWLVGMERAPGDSRIYAYQKDGFIKIVNTDGSLEPTPFLDLSAKVQNDGERGLVGLAFHPDYQGNGFFYVFYNKVGTGACTVSRFRRSPANPNIADPTEGVLLSFEHPGLSHVGGCMKFGPDGYLYISTGDGGGGGDPNGNGQNLLSFMGKILRIDVGTQGGAYTVPADNPFVGVPNTAPEIWAYGLRNPWRFNFDRWSGYLWIGDVGQDNKEEVNMQPSNSPGGENYGWSCKEGTLDFNANQCFAGSTLTDPFYEYDHIAPAIAGWCAGSITGGVVYRGLQYADLFGKYIFADFCTGKIFALQQVGAGAQVTEVGDFNDLEFSALDDDASGELFVCGVNANQVFRIKSSDCTPVAWLVAEPDINLPIGGSQQLNAYGSGMSYQWLLNGQPIAGATAKSLTVNASGTYAVVVTNPANGCSNTSNVTVVTAPAPLTASVQTTAVKCFGGNDGTATATGAGGLQVYSYQWSNGATMPSITGLTAGTYSVTVSDGSSSVVLEATLGEPSPISLELEADFDELKMWAMVSGGTPAYQYHWSTGATTDTIYNLEPNTFYEVTVTDGNGCTSVEHFYIISGADNLQEEYAFNISPNPVSNELRISFHLPTAAEATVLLFDAMGRQVQPILPNQRLEAGEQRFSTSVASLPQGVYSVVVNVDGELLARRVLKL